MVDCTFELDVLIMGGGVSGLWFLDECRRAGMNALLVESLALGSGQTVASQGILHGGLKYSLAGALGGFIDALKDMPGIWRDCLAGKREPDLREVRIRSDHCLIWRSGSFGSRIGQLGAKFGLRTPASRIEREKLPVPLVGCPGEVYRVDEQVIDPASLVSALAGRNADRIILSRSFRWEDGVAEIRKPNELGILHLRPRFLVLVAGEGNARLREGLDLPPGRMQVRPLPIMTVSGDLPDLNGHCLEGLKARAIITTQRAGDRLAIWQVASETAMEKPENFFPATWKELRASLPWFAWPGVRLSWYIANRAEATSAGGTKPTDVQLFVEGNVITAWPTKLVLAPRLSERLMNSLPAKIGGDDLSLALADWPRPRVAPFPWE